MIDTIDNIYNTINAMDNKYDTIDIIANKYNCYYIQSTINTKEFKERNNTRQEQKPKPKTKNKNKIAPFKKYIK